jgi:hypothetical protein
MNSCQNMPLELSADCIPGIAVPDKSITVLPKFSTKGRVLQESQEGGCDARYIARWQEPAIFALLHEIGDGSNPRRDDGEAGGHRFDENDPERLKVGGQTENTCILIVAIQLLRRDFANDVAVR